KDNFLRWEGKSTGIKEDKPVLNEIEKVYQEGMQALSEGNFGLVMEKIDYLLKFNPVDNGDIDFFSRAEKEKFIQETREEEPIVLSFP
ncbi:MAG: hypothetical protein NC920_04275, partial [Candidatus Omnitrophica bacterium]|nr:hypothetical protein [Candidatus Omnitrophota bacterium]